MRYITDESGNLVENPDLESGQIVFSNSVRVQFKYEDDGWKAYDTETNSRLPGFDSKLDGIPDIGEDIFRSYSEYSYVKYTDDELKAIEAQSIEAQRAEQQSLFSSVVLQAISPQLTDEQALTIDLLFDDWSGDSVAYSENDRVRYNDILYRCLQSHTSQSTWTPTDAPSLWAKCLIDPDVPGIPEWEQPSSTNGYSKGDRVTHNGKTWESTIDGNVWEPGVTGTESLWKEVS